MPITTSYAISIAKVVKMSQRMLVNACRNFTKVAAPYLYITDEIHYQETLDVLEKLMEEIGENEKSPLNAIIEMLAQAVSEYEEHDKNLNKFERASDTQPADLVMLRVLMTQHGLNTTDLPEIGSKSMVSRVLNGERELSKKHIAALAQRFKIDPALFF